MVKYLGTHNSGTSSKLVWWQRPFGYLLNLTSRCQTLSIEEQLKNNVRLFNLQVTFYNDECVFSHGLCIYTGRLLDAIETMKQYATKESPVYFQLFLDKNFLLGQNKEAFKKLVFNLLNDLRDTNIYMMYAYIEGTGEYPYKNGNIKINTSEHYWTTSWAENNSKSWVDKLPLPKRHAKIYNDKYMEENKADYLMLDFIEIGNHFKAIGDHFIEIGNKFNQVTSNTGSKPVVEVSYNTSYYNTSYNTSYDGSKPVVEVSYNTSYYNTSYNTSYDGSNSVVEVSYNTSYYNTSYNNYDYMNDLHFNVHFDGKEYMYDNNYYGLYTNKNYFTLIFDNYVPNSYQYIVNHDCSLYNFKKGIVPDGAFGGLLYFEGNVSYSPMHNIYLVNECYTSYNTTSYNTSTKTPVEENFNISYTSYSYMDNLCINVHLNDNEYIYKKDNNKLYTYDNYFSLIFDKYIGIVYNMPYDIYNDLTMNNVKLSIVPDGAYNGYLSIDGNITSYSQEHHVYLYENSYTSYSYNKNENYYTSYMR